MTHPVANYTTTVSVDRTIGEIQGLLREHGARGVATEYAENGEPQALRFSIILETGQTLYFTMPARVAQIHSLLQRRRIAPRYRTREQAQRVVWRLIKDWLRAQLSLVAAEAVTLPEVFLPYMTNDHGQTLYEHLSGRGFALPRGNGDG